MIDFSKLQSLTIPEGLVTQIADENGNILYKLEAEGGGAVVLQVEKITSNTYAGETTYTGEEFILLDIYPKTNGTVTVTYGGLTKTITDTSGAEEPNAQRVYFGTFNGVSDEVETPASGELIIEGEFYAFGCGSFQNGSKNTNIGYSNCITAVIDWGNTKVIPDHAFYYCNNVDFSVIPEGVTSIGASAFSMDYDTTNGWHTPITSVTIPSTIESIGNYAFASSFTFMVSTTNYTEYRSYVKEVKILATTPPVLGTHVWDTYNKDTMSYAAGYPNIIVPKGCVDIYKAADGWGKYANYITEAE